MRIPVPGGFIAILISVWLFHAFNKRAKEKKQERRDRLNEKRQEFLDAMLQKQQHDAKGKPGDDKPTLPNNPG